MSLEFLQFKCTKCQSVKAKSFFYKKKDRPNGIETVCKQCRLNDFKKLRTGENKDKYNRRTFERRHANWVETRSRSRRSYLKVNYGLTPEDYEKILESQGGGCAICGGRRNFRGDQKMLHVDHNHETGKNRGILCSKCNNGLGYFGDNEELLTRAIAYLKRWTVSS